MPRETFDAIAESQIKKASIATLADRPNSVSRYGDSNLSAQELKERFDAFPHLVQKKINEIIDALASASASKYITLDAHSTGKDNLYDFIALFTKDASNGKSIADFIYALYTAEQAASPASKSISEIFNDMASRLAALESARVALQESVSNHETRISANETQITNHEERISGIEQYLGGDNFIVDDSIAYQKVVPKNACERARILTIGGMSHKNKNLIQDARVNSIKICGANLAEMKNGTYNLLNEGVATPYNATLNDGHIRINKMVSESSSKVDSSELMQYTAVKLSEGSYTLSFTSVKMSDDRFVGVSVIYDGTRVVSGASIDGGYTLSISIDKPTTIKYGFDVTDNDETAEFDWYFECDVMLNNGVSALPFKPVVVKSISVPTIVQNQPFSGVGINKEIYNYYDVKNKKVYTKCKKIVLDGSADEEWTIDSGYFKTVIPGISTVLGGSGIAHLVCDKYQQDFGDNLQDATPSIKDLHFYGRSSWFGYGAVVFHDSTVSLDVNEWRTRLNEKPITLVYSLAVPSVMDVSSMVTNDGIIDVEGGGTITAVNEYNLPSPISIKYLVTYPKEV